MKSYALIVTTLFLIIRIKCIDLNPFFNSNIKICGGIKVEGNILNDISCDEIQSCFIKGQILASEQWEHEQFLPLQGVTLHRNNTGFFRYNTGALSKYVEHLKYTSLVVKKSLEIFLCKYKHRYNLPANILMHQLYEREFQLNGTEIERKLKWKPKYNKYRTIDGSYNNELHSNWGMTYTPYQRLLLKPNYINGIHLPDRTLPSARTISVQIFSGQSLKSDSNLTLIASEMAQVIAHDCTMLIIDNNEYGPIKCCTSDGQHELPIELRHTSCLSIPVERNDNFFKNHNQKWLPFVRSVTMPNSNGLLAPIEQVNGVTSYLDCSFLYGSTISKAKSLRSFCNGQLLINEDEMLPTIQTKFCDIWSSDECCYRAGDSRVNQNPHLVTIQTVFLRAHNQFARRLHILNAHWNDEKLYQETRRLIIAIYQHIIYKEYLPLILGKSFVDSLFSDQDKFGYTYNYNANVNAASYNSMSIIFRCFHSTIPHTIQTFTEYCELLGEYNFSDYLLRPVLCKNKFDQILNSFSCSPMMSMSATVTPEITNTLFKSFAPFGLDLIAMDIQRGRDHGMSNYNEFRRISGLKPVYTFEQLYTEMDYKYIEKLKNCYKNVNDIELLVGSMLERHVDGTKFGPTILYILQQQFNHFMVGDRFFYTNKHQPYPFTPDQLEQIQKFTIAKLLCDNSNNMKWIQGKAFQLGSEYNRRILCSNLLTIDLNPWKEKL